MAQSARESRKTPLSMEPFWERPTSDPPIRWEKWRIEVKLAILAHEIITLDTLLQPKPTMVRLPAEPKYEMAIEDAAEETTRNRQIRNSQLKLQWDLKCQKITEAGVLCGEQPWHLCDQKCVSLLYLSIGTEGRRLLSELCRLCTCPFPHGQVRFDSKLHFWNIGDPIKIMEFFLNVWYWEVLVQDFASQVHEKPLFHAHFSLSHFSWCSFYSSCVNWLEYVLFAHLLQFLCDLVMKK